MSTILIQNLKKYYGKVLASSIKELEIKDGEFFTLLGPSGCGKTTTLRMLAGLIPPDEGRILIDDKDITNFPPEKRNLTMVFQNFALFPHMNVFDNVAFGLRMRHMPEREIQIRVKEMLKMLRIEELSDRRIEQISGGQQQRVGVARAIAPHPSVVLFDEPLSNLDAKLREEVRYELKELQKKVNITAVYVTHDQAEAMTLSDRIAIMQSGIIIQIGNPKEVYFTPVNAFVASFVGGTNFIEGEIEKEISQDRVLFRSIDGLLIEARKGMVSNYDSKVLLVRPEAVELKKANENGIKGTIESKLYLGGSLEYRIRIGKNSTLKTFASSVNDVGDVNSNVTVFIKDAVVIKS
ncbi:MAG: ABC transporter ATP-binding protein [Athalassotoga sp.]|uniref:ABC transporter ATP-binding protein n=1 Tax=Athalassotoga sp. TaxID=2022597 RepID=UPI003D058B1E